MQSDFDGEDDFSDVLLDSPGEEVEDPLISREELEELLKPTAPRIVPSSTTADRVQQLRDRADGAKRRLSKLRDLDYVDPDWLRQRTVRLVNEARMAEMEADDLEAGLPFEDVEDEALERRSLEAQVSYEQSRGALKKAEGKLGMDGKPVTETPAAKLARLDFEAAQAETRRLSFEQTRRRAQSERERSRQRYVDDTAEKLAVADAMAKAPSGKARYDLWTASRAGAFRTEDTLAKFREKAAKRIEENQLGREVHVTPGKNGPSVQVVVEPER